MIDLRFFFFLFLLAFFSFRLFQRPINISTSNLHFVFTVFSLRVKFFNQCFAPRNQVMLQLSGGTMCNKILQNCLAPSHADPGIQYLFDQPLLPSHMDIVDRD